MTRLRLYAHALRAARLRQLRARAVRPLARRRFPLPAGSVRLRALPAIELWRSRAFAGADAVAGTGEVHILGKTVPYPPSDWSLAGEPRLRAFHLQYGEEILGWARRGDERAARDGLTAWIAANPPRCGDAWHPYPLSTRVGNWVAALSLLPELAADDVVESLRRQLAYLERNLEEDILGNHLIRNARALVLGGAMLDDRKLLGRGFALLEREVPEQVLPDGGHYERSPVYHSLVLRDLLEVRAATEDDRFAGPIERMRVFAAGLARPDGQPALFNDGSLNFAPELELPEPSQTVFPDTGYAVVRTDRAWLAFDCGSPAPDFLPAHAHADALSFQLWVDGRPVVVDPGSYTYERGPERDWFRSTAAHSTIGLDGRDQFELWGAFRTGPLPRPRLVSTDPLEAEVRIGGILFRRRLILEQDRLLVEDELTGPGEVEVLSSLPLAGLAQVEPVGDLSAVAETGWLSERMLEREEIEILRARGRVRLPKRLGWRIGLPFGA